MDAEQLNGADPCVIARHWGVSLEVATRAVAAADLTAPAIGRDVFIISGGRTEAQQDELRRRGRPTAPNDLSTHLSCPATGIDVSLGRGSFGVVRLMKVRWGVNAFFSGLRWGGGGAVDDAGVPIDWPHVDLGPRSS